MRSSSRHLRHPRAGSRPRACGAAASAAGRRDCRRRKGADRASIAGRRRRRRAQPGRPPCTSAPPMRMRARVRRAPARRRGASVVVLPAPVGPSRTTNSPSAMVRRQVGDGLRRPRSAWRRASSATSAMRARRPRIVQAPCGSPGRSPLSKSDSLLAASGEADRLAAAAPCVPAGSRALTWPAVGA